MDNFALFSDGSVNPRLRIGAGAYLLLPARYLHMPVENIRSDLIKNSIVFRKFQDTSSTKLEIQTVLWALEDCRKTFQNARQQQLGVLFTDSQNIIRLPEQRMRLETHNFTSKRTGHPLNNADLYRRFFALYDEMNFQINKVAGHARSGGHDTVQRIFSIVDQEVRKSLRRWITESERFSK